MNIRRLIPLSMRRKFIWCFSRVFRKNFYDKYHWQEANVSYGNENPDKTFYVIRKYPKAMGLLSCYLSALILLREKVVSGNLIPIMDMQSHFYGLIHSKKDRGKKINAWEYYFCQMSEYGIDDISKSKNVILSQGIGVTNDLLFGDEQVDFKKLQPWIEIDKTYFLLKESLQERFDSSAADIIKNRRVVATMVREGYMVLSKTYREYVDGHPKQPSIGEIMDDVERRMKEWNCDYVFVSAETTLVVNEFKKRFGEKALFTDRPRRDIDSLEDFNKYKKIALKFNKEHSRVAINEDYLEEVYLMSKCTALCAGKCSASIVAALWNRGKYENMEIIQKGLY